MTRVAVLSADLVANSTRFESGLARANRAMNQSRAQWQSNIERSSRNFRALEASVNRGTNALTGMQSAIKGVAAAAIGGFSVGAVVRYSDAFTNLFTQIGNFTSSATEQRRVFNDLFAAAQRTGTGIEGLGQTFGRLSGALPDLLRQNYNLVDVTELLARGFSAAGATAQTTEGALLQLSQGLATNFKAAGQELNSFIEGAPALAKIIAKQLGGESAVDLKKFATEGKLTAQTFLDALMKSRDAIEAFAVPPTVGRSLERVRNSLIKMVGESETLQSGAAGLADSIDYLAENIDTLIRLGAAVAVIMGGRVLSSFIASNAAMAVGAINAARYTAAMNAATAAAASSATVQAALTKATLAANGSMAASTIVVGQTGRAVVATSTAMGTAAVAARGLGSALLTMVGGPIGATIAAVAGSIYLMANNTSGAEKAQNSFNDALLKAKDIHDQLNPSMAKRNEELAKARDLEIQNAEKAIAHTEALIEQAKALTVVNALTVSRTGMTPEQINAPNIADWSAQLDEMRKKLAETKTEIAKPIKGGGGLLGGGGGKADKDKVEEILKALQRENEATSRAISLYGEKASALDIANKRAEIANQLADTNQKLTTKQRDRLEELLNVYDQQTIKLEQQEEATKKAKEAEEERKRTLDSLFSNFESSIEDAIINGGKLSDVMQGLLEDIMRALIRAQIVAPLIDAIKSGVGSGGSSGGIFGFLGRLLPSFAVGSYNVPYDMTANIHKGEMIIPAKQAAALRAGGGGAGQGVTVNVINQNGSAVSTKSKQDGNGVSIDVMIQQSVAKGISDRNSPIAAALNARDQRTLTRR